MVGPISVFPDVGGAFFGSYRQARGQRLQEAAMRAEMAAAQADRQRQAQARESFARLQGPDQRTETVTDSTSFGPSLIGYSQNRVTREGLTLEQRAREEQRLAQASPELYSGYRQSQAGPEARDYSDIYAIQANRVANGNATVEEAARVVAGLGGDPRAHAAEIQARVQQQEADQVNGTVIQTEQGQILINPRTGERIAQYGPRPTQPRGPLVSFEGDRPDRGLPVGTPLTGAYLNDYFGGQAYPEDGLYMADVRNSRGEHPIQPYQEPDLEGDEDTALIEAQNRNRAQFGATLYDGGVRAMDILMENPQASGAGSTIMTETPFVSSLFSETDRGRLGAALSQLASVTSLETLQNLRSASETGGALGQVSNFENQMMAQTLGNLRQDQPAEDLAYNLTRALNLHHAVVNGYNGRSVTSDTIEEAIANGPFGNPSEMRQGIIARRSALRSTAPSRQTETPPPPPGFELEQ